MNNEEKQFFENLILNLKIDLQSDINGQGDRLDKDIAEVQKELALHNQRGDHIEEIINDLPCKEHDKRINNSDKHIGKIKEESKLKDKEHDTQLKIQWIFLWFMFISIAGTSFFLLKDIIK